jgi:hypothetical protein
MVNKSMVRAKKTKAKMCVLHPVYSLYASSRLITSLQYPIVEFPMFRHVIGLKAGGPAPLESGEDLKLMPAV